MTPIQQRRRRLRIQAVVGVLLLAGLLIVNGPPLIAFGKSTYHNYEINKSSYKRQYGHWANVPVPTDEKVNAVHAIMLHTGKVLIMAGSGNEIGNFDAGKFESIVWNPKDNSFKKIPTPYDMFCSGHYILPDGKVLIAGGTSRYEVMASQIKYAAGIMTVVNHSAREHVVLPTGTVFQSPTGQAYRATAAVSIPPAQRVRQNGPNGYHWVTYPSYTPLWVKAVAAGQGSVSKVNREYTVAGLPSTAAVNLQATSGSITRSLQNYWGTRKAYIFDPSTERYEKVSDMNLARWYPTLVGLKDGDVMAVSGLDQFGDAIKGQSELWSPKTKKWTVDFKLKRSFPTYPALFLMPNGDLFFTGASAGYGLTNRQWRDPGIWDPNTNKFTPVVSGLQDYNQMETAGSILLPPAQDQKYAIIGGGGVGQSPLSTGRIDVVNLNSKHPTWHNAGYLPQGTRYPEVVITPTDGVVISGGSRGYRGMHGSDIMECYMWMPSRSSVTKLAQPLTGRDYHAEGLLLPDGRILTLGGNPLFGNKQDTLPQSFNQRITVYSPPYLYHGAQPSLTGGPAELQRGETATFATPHPGAIVKARLMHPSAVTHVTDVQQRSIALGLRRTAHGVKLTVPTNSGLVPPGWYMLFVDNAKGVPSVARWVHIS